MTRMMLIGGMLSMNQWAIIETQLISYPKLLVDNLKILLESGILDSVKRGSVELHFDESGKVKKVVKHEVVINL